MADVTRLHLKHDSLDEAELPFRIELRDAGGGTLLALSASPAIAFAAYYAAAREYFGREVLLRRDGVILARFSA